MIYSATHTANSKNAKKMDGFKIQLFASLYNLGSRLFGYLVRTPKVLFCLLS